MASISNTIQQTSPFKANPNVPTPVAQAKPPAFGTPSISGLFSSVNNSLPKFGQTAPASTAGPFSTNSALQASANAAQASKIATNTPQSGAPVGNTVASTAGVSGLVSPSQTNNSLGTSNPNAGYGGGAFAPNLSGQSTPQSGTSVTGGTTPVKGLFPSVASSLAGFDPFSNPAVSGAYNKAQGLATTLQQSRTNEANAEAQNRLNPIPIGDQTGREAVMRNQYLQQQTALSQEMGAQSQLYSAGLQGTQQQLSGLGTVAGLAPEATRYDAFGAGNLSPQNQAASLAQQVKAGLISPDAAASQLNSIYGGAGATFLNQALGGNYNYNAGNAQSAAQQSNIQTQGTLNTQIGAQGVQQATQNYVAANTAYQTADAQAKTLINTLNQTGINTNPQFVNQKINALQNQLGSANYASFITALNETKQAYTNLLSSVGASTPTVNGQQATDIFNANSTPAQINAAIQQLNIAAKAKLQPLYDQIGTYSGIGGSGSSSSSSTSTSGFGWNGQ